MNISLAERFWRKVDKNGPIPTFRPDLGNCWNWTAYKDRNGYGKFNIGGIVQRGHVVSLNLSGIQVPKGMVTDHLCRNPGCVRPEHLEVVTYQINTDRGLRAKRKFCVRGHSYDGDNIYIRNDNGVRQCKKCEPIRERIRRERKRTLRMCGILCRECGKPWGEWEDNRWKKIFCSTRCGNKLRMREYIKRHGL